jgi:hypothetical protein
VSRTTSIRTMTAATIAAAALSGPAPDARAQTPELPDLYVAPDFLFDNRTATDPATGNAIIEFSTGVANLGLGPLHLYSGDEIAPGVQEVWQRVFNDDGSWTDRLSGEFIYHPSHSHIHFEGWAEYRLREILPGDGVGPVVALGEKISFCVVDSSRYDSSLPNHPFFPGYTSCNPVVQGLSVGWVDIYSKYLADQELDVEHITPGTYWLEAEVDPLNQIEESDETNNVSRVKVAVDALGAADAYEPNDSLPFVEARAPGAINSPNLGPCDPIRVVQGLSVNRGDDEDLFRFYMPGVGGAGDHVSIDWDPAGQPLGLELLTGAGTPLATGAVSGDGATIPLAGVGPGWYLARVWGDGVSINLDYTLTVDPSSNAAPSVEATAPPAGDLQLQHAYESLVVEWTASDPDDDPLWVRVYLSHHPFFDGHEAIDPASFNTDAASGVTVVNSAEVDPGTYWIYVEVSDGGTTVGDWSEGTVTFVPAPTCEADMNGDGKTDIFDFGILADEFGVTGESPADVNHDHIVDVFDFGELADDFGCDVN